MATPESTSTSTASAPDLAALQAELARVNAAIEERRIEELKVLADGYAKKLQRNGFSIREGMDALKPYLRLRG
jgi:DNA-binding protein H-NS